MKIAVPSLSSNIESLISDSLGRAPYIIIFDSETSTSIVFENTGFTSQDGSGLKAAKTIIRSKANILLTMQIGQKAYSVLIKEHIDICLITSVNTVKTIINNYIKNRRI